MQIENKNTTVLPPTSGFLKTDGGVSRESQLFLERHLPHQQEHHISFIQYFCNVSRSSLSVVHRLHGVIGLALLPLQFIVLLLMMILKLLVLNPPLCSSLQSTIRFELPSPARVAPSMNFRQGVETIYSFNYQTANRPNVKSRFVASPTSSIWWEDAVLGNFVRLPLFALPYGYLQDSDDISMIQLPLWALHPFTGVVFLKEQPGTRQVVVTGAFQCWSWLRPLYRWFLESVFEPYAIQLVSLSDANLVVDIQCVSRHSDAKKQE